MCLHADLGRECIPGKRKSKREKSRFCPSIYFFIPPCNAAYHFHPKAQERRIKFSLLREESSSVSRSVLVGGNIVNSAKSSLNSWIPKRIPAKALHTCTDRIRLNPSTPHTVSRPLFLFIPMSSAGMCMWGCALMCARRRRRPSGLPLLRWLDIKFNILRGRSGEGEGVGEVSRIRGTVGINVFPIFILCECVCWGA